MLLLAVAIIWVLASYIVKSALDRGIGAFVFTYICNSLFILYLPLYYISAWCLRRRSQRSSASVGPDTGAEAENGSRVVPTSAPQLLRAALGRGPTARAWRAGLWVSPFWFAAQLTFNQSLKRTSVASNTIISSSSAVFTFIISYFLLSESVNVRKVGAVVLSCAGTVLVVGLCKRRIKAKGPVAILISLFSCCCCCCCCWFWSSRLLVTAVPIPMTKRKHSGETCWRSSPSYSTLCTQSF